MIKLVAVGNRFMKDDSIAIKVIEHIGDKLKNLNLEIIIGETDSQGCFYLLDSEDFIIILDAQSIGIEPGMIHVYSLEEAILLPSHQRMQHDSNIIDLMKLYNKAFKGYIIGIEVSAVEFGDDLSPILQERFPFICSKIEALVKNLIMEVTNNA